MSLFFVTADRRAYVTDAKTQHCTEVPWTFEAAYLAEKAKLRGRGSVKALIHVGKRVFVFWERACEVWGPEA